MSFSSQFDARLNSLFARNFRRLLEPISDARLQQRAADSAAITRRIFGRTMRLFAPLYLSNECINSCSYCGFSRENSILRVTLEIEQMLAEARYLVNEGFRNILLVAGEHPKFVSNNYLEQCVRRLVKMVPSVSLEVAPMETPRYLPLVAAGAEGLIVYQETYHRPTYAELHVYGPKKNFNWRLDCPERAYEAGFRRLGIGALLGLWDWREEAVALALHIDWLLKFCWKSHLTVSLPRIKPAVGGFEPPYPLTDREFIQLICALRLTFPHIGMVMSTREPAALRDAVATIGFTMMSAGSHTEPGGYTQGMDVFQLSAPNNVTSCTKTASTATEQFVISDTRQPAIVAEKLSQLGLEPVWKDWDAALNSSSVRG